MVYKANIPQPSSFISQSQKDFVGNYETLSNVWGKTPVENENVGDHIPLSERDQDELGKHKKVTLVEQDPAPAAPLANQLNLYTKEASSLTEMFYQRNGDASAFQITSNKGIVQGGIVLRAYVAFDFHGNIIEIDDIDEDGEPIKRQLAFNVSSVSTTAIPPALNTASNWTINFTNSIPSADYFWICQSMNEPNPSSSGAAIVQSQPNNSAVYSSVVTQNSFNMILANVFRDGVSGGLIAVSRGLRMVFQAYTAE